MVAGGDIGVAWAMVRAAGRACVEGGWRLSRGSAPCAVHQALCGRASRLQAARPPHRQGLRRRRTRRPAVTPPPLTHALMHCRWWARAPPPRWAPAWCSAWAWPRRACWPPAWALPRVSKRAARPACSARAAWAAHAPCATLPRRNCSTLPLSPTTPGVMLYVVFTEIFMNKSHGEFEAAGYSGGGRCCH